MTSDLIDVLRKYQDEPGLGAILKAALHFVEGAQYKFLQTAQRGQPSVSVAQMYEVRKRHCKLSAFTGLDESIQSLRKRDVTVRLAIIETDRGFVSIWLADESSPPMAVVIAKFDS
jgi:hypothetical protein